MTSTGYGKINGTKGGNRCSCCPYGYHIDVEFVQYCEALLASLQGRRASSSSSSRGSFSLNRPPKRLILTSTTSLPNDDATYQWLCDQNQNKTNGHGKPGTANHNLFHRSSPLSNNSNGLPQFSPNHINSPNFLHRLRPVGRSNSSSRIHDILNPPSPVDKSLTDAVELFEKVLKEHEQAAFSYSVPSSPAPYTPSPLTTSTPVRRGSFPRFNGSDLINHGNSSPISPNPLTGLNRASESQPSSPAGFSNISSNNHHGHQTNHHNGVNKTLFNQFRDQLQVSVQKMRDLEQQVKDIPVLKQKIILLQAERKRLLEKVNPEDSVTHNDDRNSPLDDSRVEELEKSGIITPPLSRRKFLFQSDSLEGSQEYNFDDKHSSSRLATVSPVSFKSLKLQNSSFRDHATQTDQLSSQIAENFNDNCKTEQPEGSSQATATSKLYKNILSINNNVESISIRPTSLSIGKTSTFSSINSPSQRTELLSTGNVMSPISSNNDLPPKVYRSIGISVNIAPTLPRRSMVNSRESETKKGQLFDDDLKQEQQHISPNMPTATTTLPSFALPKPLLMSRGTNPMPLERHDAITQANPKILHASVGTDYFHLRETGINCNYRKDLNIRDNHQSSQTDEPKAITTEDKITQINLKCSHCELKQMETIGVGSGLICSPLTPSSITNASEVGVNTEASGLIAGNTRMVDSMISSISSMASSIQSIKLCDKCNETITSLAREVVIKDKTPSPGIGSRIPRLANSLPPQSSVTETPLQSCNPQHQQQSTEMPCLSIKSTNLSNKIIIEEGNDDEILVFRDPNANLGSRKHRSNFPSMMTPQVDLENIRLFEEACKISDSESEGDDDEDPESFSSSEGTYILEDGVIVPGRKMFINNNTRPKEIIKPSKELRAALKVLNDSLLKPDLSNKPATAKSVQIIEKEWFSIAACKDSDPTMIEVYLDCFESFSAHLLNKIVNLTDSSGNTAMHYAISHSNFDVVSVLLDSKVCDVNKQNKAGYTAIMLVSTARVSNETQKEVIRRLFNLGDVNIRAKQNGQTALMLASSHGQFTTCKLLLEAGAALNVQDNDGSTALMCATEHGHIEIVKLLLSHPECDPNIADNDKATAMSIAMECGRKDIAVLLYASCNMLSRGSSPYASLRRSQSKAITTQLQRTGSFSSRSNQGNRSFALAPSPPTRSRHSSAKSSASQHRSKR
ncbi:uncharacterized protein LOC107371513 [Tetranychus urticae]|uniref:Uncharacterized protein n=1 Tax=Tetranychus urticae TaxID=32264 RepID=T1JX25_TETUR|nr:uncharacterized protein LOC107371513 [Tetranychus urticae]